MSFVRRRLATETVNVFKSAFKDRRRGRTENLGWETPLARIARTLTWILQRPKSQGLTPNTDGFFRVRDVLKHPSLEGLDFFSIERAVRAYRPHHITLVYSPRKTSDSESSSQVTSWWIALHPSQITSPSRRLIHAEDVPDMVYKVPTAYWETIRKRGLSRKFNKPLSFSTENIVPPNHEGDYTFIRLDPQKLLDSEHTSNFPIYSTHRYSTKPRFHEYSQTFTTHAPIIPPSTFESVIRIAVERFPLMVRASTLSNNDSSTNKKEKRRSKKKKRKKEKENEDRMVVMQSGIEALEKFGYGGMLRGTKLQQLLREQEDEKAPKSSQTQKPRLEAEEAQNNIVKEEVASTKSILETLKCLAIKDPPPHNRRAR